MRRACFHTHGLDEAAINLQKLFLLRRIVRDGLGNIRATAMRNLQWRTPILIHAGKNDASFIDERVDVKHFARNEARQQIIRRALAQDFALVHLFDKPPDFFSRLQLLNANRGNIRARFHHPGR